MEGGPAGSVMQGQAVSPIDFAVFEHERLPRAGRRLPNAREGARQADGMGARQSRNEWQAPAD